jgi:hypothetical protein
MVKHSCRRRLDRHKPGTLRHFRFTRFTFNGPPACVSKLKRFENLKADKTLPFLRCNWTLEQKRVQPRQALRANDYV